MLDRAEIPFRHWQMKRDASGAAVLGEISAEIDCLTQEIRQCVLTPKGSVPLNPEKGCDLESFRDRPMNIGQMFVVAEIKSALARDVPRITVNIVDVDTLFDGLKIVIKWAPLEWVQGEFIETVLHYAG